MIINRRGKRLSFVPMNFSTFNISFGNENPAIITESYHMGFGTNSLVKKNLFFFSLPTSKGLM